MSGKHALLLCDRDARWFDVVDFRLPILPDHDSFGLP
jgi:hypothetical protein